MLSWHMNMRRTQFEAWLKALRSGRYKQGYGYLKRNDAYCCLGVLCEVVAGLNLDWPEVGDLSGVSVSSCPPELRNLIPSIVIRQYLSQLNDRGVGQIETLRPWTFLGIADWLESQERRGHLIFERRGI